MQTNLAYAPLEEPLIELSGVKKSYGNAEILKNITMSVNQGELISILGPSGCGKSTLLNIITGLTDADEGSVHINGRIGYMQQKDLLLPWKSVVDNITLPQILRGSDKKRIRKEAGNNFELFGLQGYENKYPYELSGGMKQRASFLRTFLSTDEIMLLDEPFGALDSITRSKLQQWLLEMKERLNITILFITHDIEEAVLLSDRIYVLSDKPSVVKKEIQLGFFRENKVRRLISKEFIDVKKEIISYL